MEASAALPGLLIAAVPELAELIRGKNLAKCGQISPVQQLSVQWESVPRCEGQGCVAGAGEGGSRLVQIGAQDQRTECKGLRGKGNQLAHESPRAC